MTEHGQRLNAKFLMIGFRKHLVTNRCVVCDKAIRWYNLNLLCTLCNNRERVMCYNNQIKPSQQKLS